ncbi:hypothetical protein [Haloarcula sp. CBA1127]|uniref:hypothetical protein n=1 Tax=Haloarcula sp. CBA1127 TaxID=1765055 RepID=UPI0012AB9748|nr:hypothetical protein [Haloarcula sp. CBA1127]
MCVDVGQPAREKLGLGGWWVATARDASGALRSALSRASRRSIVPAVAGAIPACRREVDENHS